MGGESMTQRLKSCEYLYLPQTQNSGRSHANRSIITAMGDLLKLIWYAVAGLFRSRAALQTEVLTLRHQLNVLRRRAPKRVTVSNIDRLVFGGSITWLPEVLDAVKILKPEDHHQMASRWLPSLVALEIKARAAVDPEHLMRLANSFVR
jgi:hypothetical protein